MTYSVIPTEDLRALCIERNWFTCGSTAQYEKLFYANLHGCPIEEIATIIWLCSDDELHCRRDILADLREAREAKEANLPVEEMYNRINKFIDDNWGSELAETLYHKMLNIVWYEHGRKDIGEVKALYEKYRAEIEE